MSPAHDKLLALEKEFWTGDEEFFLSIADNDCLVALTEMAGVMNNEDLAATAKNPNRWKQLESS
jgi:hypothetical protein